MTVSVLISGTGTRRRPGISGTVKLIVAHISLSPVNDKWLPGDKPHTFIRAARISRNQAAPEINFLRLLVSETLTGRTASPVLPFPH